MITNLDFKNLQKTQKSSNPENILKNGEDATFIK